MRTVRALLRGLENRLSTARLGPAFPSGRSRSRRWRLVIRSIESSIFFMEREPCRRRRPALSCLECRRRKIRCNRNDPCANCTSAKARFIYKVYSNEVARQHPQQGSSLSSTLNLSAYAPSPLAQAQQINTNGPITDDYYHPSELQTDVAVSAGQNDTPATPGCDNNQPPNHAQDAGPDLRDLLQRLQKLENSSASAPVHGLSETNWHILKRQCGLQDSQVALNKTRILGWSHWMGTATEV